jgi:alkanesulfonate monooxygenase SsuD/methylene tetrahydromethanopterin reductase-like flavin-dependent oxidoreductase (luciferase family)
VARYADACNLFATTTEDVAHKLEVLREHCDAEGRDYDAIRKTATCMGPVLDDPYNFIADSERYAKLGISQWDLMPDRHPVEYTERLAELVPRLAAL